MEYKFRGKALEDFPSINIKKGDWVYGGIYTENSNVYIVKYLSPYEDLFFVDVDPETVGQYTGLKDKNGREIYKGDIVKFQTWKGYNDMGEVVWAENNGFYIKGTRDEDIFWHPDNVKDLEVVSNIHDNPELLGEEK